MVVSFSLQLLLSVPLSILTVPPDNTPPTPSFPSQTPHQHRLPPPNPTSPRPAPPWPDVHAETTACVCRSEYGIEIRAAMDDRNKATMAVFVDSSHYNPYYGPELNYGCSVSSCLRHALRPRVLCETQAPRGGSPLEQNNPNFHNLAGQNTRPRQFRDEESNLQTNRKQVPQTPLMQKI